MFYTEKQQIDFLNKYGLVLKDKIKLDIKNTYIQCRPNKPIDFLLKTENGVVDTHMYNSPHCKICKLYLHNGGNWLKKNYRKTKYYKMMKFFGKKKINLDKIIGLCDSIKKGYLRKPYQYEHVIVLMKPLAMTRYDREVSLLSPEIFSGHHRAAALLALKKNYIDIIVAEDNRPGTHMCYGKIHKFCKKQ